MPPCTPDILDMNIHSKCRRTVYLTRHGESCNNLYGRIGGDAALSSRGEQYAAALGLFVNNLATPCNKVITSRLQRTHQTAAYINISKEERDEIDEINAGDHDNMTYEDIAEQFPEEFALRDMDKLNYRYPQGESYMDVVARLKPLVSELEQDDNILVISHQATIRCILTLLLDTPMQDLPYLKIPLHTVMKLNIPESGAITIEYIRLPVDCVDTYRPKPENCSLDRKLEDACLTVPFHL